MRLFLLIGQSNMAGRGPLEGPDINAEPEKNIYKLDDNGVWLNAKEPVHNDKPELVGVGPGLAFARTVLGTLNGEKIGLIPCAVGGTKIGRWIPGGDLYERAVSRAWLALESGQLSGILWAQGESDSELEADAAVYKDRLFSLIQGLRQELAAEEVPFIAAKLGGFIGRKNIRIRARLTGRWSPLLRFLTSSFWQIRLDLPIKGIICIMTLPRQKNSAGVWLRVG
ncbi:sialate O-acetylesterase [Paenibacillus sp. DMB5]|uniref:sialate O-acetylesterase n=1 Tax=Paenibacillus sp. DMB5 TaxID=1780103 RepID=UPI00076C565D|nr:sialate O-acetylesterase [Paenibacillus sp. DMB5]KUP25259.1 hypothetical protein AWJ19_17990 [Paenibacillus sp. DMB5]